MFNLAQTKKLSVETTSETITLSAGRTQYTPTPPTGAFALIGGFTNAGDTQWGGVRLYNDSWQAFFYGSSSGASGTTFVWLVEK